MNLISVFNQFPDQQSCITHLEAIRWPEKPTCPLCGSDDVARKQEGRKIGRWNCHQCTSNFNVLSGTVFRGTATPLQKWFLAICLMSNAKKSLSSCQLARDLQINQRTAWHLQRKIRQAMDNEDCELLKGLIETDETYIGGKPRWKRSSNPRGRDTSKSPVLGAVTRAGRVKARVVDDTKKDTIMEFLAESIDMDEVTAVISDEYPAYRSLDTIVPHAVIDHRFEYVSKRNPNIHTNSIESFWAGLKRAWTGTHHHYSRKHMQMYVAESCWKYNHRKDPDPFSGLLRACMKV